MSRKIITGDDVVILSGKNKGKVGKVIKVMIGKFKQKSFIKVSGINLCKKSIKYNNSNQGGFKYIECPIDISKAAIFDVNLGLATKICYHFVDDRKARVMKSSGQVIG